MSLLVASSTQLGSCSIMVPNRCKNPCCSTKWVPRALLATSLGCWFIGATGTATCNDCITGMALTVEGFGLGLGFMNANSEPSCFLFRALSFYSLHCCKHLIQSV